MNIYMYTYILSSRIKDDSVSFVIRNGTFTLWNDYVVYSPIRPSVSSMPKMPRFAHGNWGFGAFLATVMLCLYGFAASEAWIANDSKPNFKLSKSHFLPTLRGVASLDPSWSNGHWLGALRTRAGPYPATLFHLGTSEEGEKTALYVRLFETGAWKLQESHSSYVCYVYDRLTIHFWCLKSPIGHPQMKPFATWQFRSPEWNLCQAAQASALPLFGMQLGQAVSEGSWYLWCISRWYGDHWIMSRIQNKSCWILLQFSVISCTSLHPKMYRWKLKATSMQPPGFKIVQSRIEPMLHSHDKMMPSKFATGLQQQMCRRSLDSQSSVSSLVIARIPYFCVDVILVNQVVLSSLGCWLVHDVSCTSFPARSVFAWTSHGSLQGFPLALEPSWWTSPWCCDRGARTNKPSWNASSMTTWLNALC